MSDHLPWWKTLFEIHHAEGCWQEPESFTKQDIAFLAEILVDFKNDKILDLACGIGRHTIGLAREGFHVHGIDISPVLIEDAIRHIPSDLSGKVSFDVGDMRALDYRHEFGEVILMDVSFGFFDEEANLRVLRNISKALQTGGTFLLEVFNPPYLPKMIGRDWFQAGDRYVLRQTRLDETNATIEFLGRSIRVCDGAMTEHPPQRIRYYTLDEIRDMLKSCGLEMIDVLGSKDVGDSSNRQLTTSSIFMEIVTRKRMV